MYCNLFDTVRIDTCDLVQAEGLFFHMILSGYHPTLSMNQSVDSAAISILSGRHSAFRDLIEQEAIRFSLFASHKSTIDYLATHLAPVDGAPCNPFHFSSLPFLYEAYSPAERQRIFCAMLDMLYGRVPAITRDVAATHSHCEQLNAYVHAARDLASRLTGKYLPPANVDSELLAKRVERFFPRSKTSARISPSLPFFWNCRTKSGNSAVIRA